MPRHVFHGGRPLVVHYVLVIIVDHAQNNPTVQQRAGTRSCDPGRGIVIVSETIVRCICHLVYKAGRKPVSRRRQPSFHGVDLPLRA
jgi:hypothetical protein